MMDGEIADDSAVPAIVMRSRWNWVVKFRIEDAELRDALMPYLASCEISDRCVNELEELVRTAHCKEMSFGCLTIELANESELAEHEREIRLHSDTLGKQQETLTCKLKEVTAKQRLRLDIGRQPFRGRRIEYGLLTNCDLNQDCQRGRRVFDDCNRYECYRHGTELEAERAYAEIANASSLLYRGRRYLMREPKYPHAPLIRATFDLQDRWPNGLLHCIPCEEDGVREKIGGDGSSVMAIRIQHDMIVRKNLSRPFYRLNVLYRKLVEIS